MNYRKHPKPILEQNNAIHELDDLVAALSNQRFTFTEEEVLRPFWEMGEEIRLREDARFWQLDCGHWHLAEHRSANDYLVEHLRAGSWDGTHLEEMLSLMDSETGRFNVFCPVDPRLVCVDGNWRLADSESLPVLTDETRLTLDQLADDLLERWQLTSRSPWHTRDIQTCLGELGWTSDDSSLLIITAWLISRNHEWARVAKDLWIPNEFLPGLSLTYYRVTGITPDPATPSLVQFSSEESETNEGDETEQENEILRQPPTSSVEDRILTWKVALRTLHLNNGYIPVPPEVISGIRRWIGMGDVIYVQGIWFEDAARFDLWLDVNNGRLYGDGLADRIGLLDAGSILKARWDVSGVLLSVVGVNEEINQEEARLIDPDSLASLRRGLGESYRVSIHAILTAEVDGLPVSELHRRLCERQGHAVHHGSLRAILCLCPEFYRIGRLWKLKPDVNGAPDLRKSLVRLEAEVQGQIGLAGLHRVARDKIDQVFRRLTHQDG